MANLTLCRLARSISGVSRLVSRNDILSSTYSNGLIKKVKSASPFSTYLKYPLKVSSGILPQYSSKALSELPASSSLLQYRAASTTGNHVPLWQIERIVSVAFIPLFPACIILENPIVDSLFATLVVMHAHWGLEAVILDYARPSVVGPILPKVAFLALYLFSAATFVGLLALVYNGPGIGKTVKNFWSIGGESPSKGNKSE